MSVPIPAPEQIAQAIQVPWLPAGAARLVRKCTYFGGLYQRLELERLT